MCACSATGTGKTIAFLVPLLECLLKKQWTKHCGLGALVITPTRELAYQTFEVVNAIGGQHSFSVALLIGGRVRIIGYTGSVLCALAILGNDVEYEKKRLAAVNIIICTPGRLLQHMDENEHFTCDQLQMLVLDESDRILDMGFRTQVSNTFTGHSLCGYICSVVLRWMRSSRISRWSGRHFFSRRPKHAAWTTLHESRYPTLCSFPLTRRRMRLHPSSWSRYVEFVSPIYPRLYGLF